MHAQPFKGYDSLNTECHSCGYIRLESDLEPPWQCPGCKKAYNKTSKKPDEELSYSREELADKNRSFIESARKENLAEVSRSRTAFIPFIAFFLGLAIAFASDLNELVLGVWFLFLFLIFTWTTWEMHVHGYFGGDDIQLSFYPISDRKEDHPFLYYSTIFAEMCGALASFGIGLYFLIRASL